jgi:hypothetical protein
MFGTPDDATVEKMLIAQLTNELVATEHKDLFIEAGNRAKDILSKLTSEQKQKILAETLRVSMQQFMQMQSGQEITPVKIMDLIKKTRVDIL